jgi:hypothetical protein
MGKNAAVISLTEDDYKQKSFKTAPAGTYTFKISKQKTAIKDGKAVKVYAVITKGPHKGTGVFDHIAAHVGWKIAQLLHALGIKKMTITLQEFAKLIGDKELRAIIREEKFEGKTRNKIVQWLPLEASDDEDENDEELDDDEDEADDEDEDDEAEDEDDDADESEDDEDGEDDDEDDDESGDDEEDEDDEDDEEEEKPARRAPAKKAATKRAPAKSAAKTTAKKTTRKR